MVTTFNPRSVITLTITNPQRRTSVLVTHELWDEDDAAELAAIYKALGYAKAHIAVSHKLVASI